jgi:hypothetical protein
MSKPARNTSRQPTPEMAATPAEYAAADDWLRKNRHTAAYKVGTWPIVDTPLPMLAQYIVELDADDRPEFLRELAARLPADAVQPLIDALRARLDAPAA